MRQIDTQTVEFDISFTEPTTSVDNTPLTDLAYSTVYVTSPAGTLKAPVVAAGSVHGGEGVRTVVQVSAPAGRITSITFAVSCTDLAGNEGPKSEPVTTVVDRIGPAVPTGFIVG